MVVCKAILLCFLNQPAFQNFIYCIAAIIYHVYNTSVAFKEQSSQLLFFHNVQGSSVPGTMRVIFFFICADAS